jgi:hypothetical protein
MSAGRGPHFERLTDLLADRAVQGLSVGEAAELDRLLADDESLEAEEFELAAAAADRAFAAGDRGETLPRHLFERIEADAIAAFARAEDVRPAVRVHAGSERGVQAPMRGRGGVAGRRWGMGVALVAALTIAALGWWEALRPPARADVEQTRAMVLAAADHVQWSWTAWDAKPAEEGGEPFAAGGVRGEVVWSTERQTGVMRFTGLPRNTPSQMQYQLWIIDPAQKHPIDGGVFDADCDGVLTVAIDPKIRVSGVAAFAITAEKPGGVVVSDQSKRVVIAAPASKG